MLTFVIIGRPQKNDRITMNSVRISLKYFKLNRLFIIGIYSSISAVVMASVATSFKWAKKYYMINKTRYKIFF